MANKYANLTGTNRISEEYELINEGFDGVQADVQALETKATTAANHIANTSNPHNTTKSQVGLGSVENYGIATQAEAQAGTVSNKHMTPQRTAQAIASLGPATAPVQSVAGKTGAVTLTADDVSETTANKIMTSAERTKLASVAANAQPNQNAISNINGITADTPQTAVTIQGGTGITVTQDAANKRVTITSTGTSTPGAHASSHLPGGSDAIPVATTTQGGLMSAEDKVALGNKLDKATQIPNDSDLNNYQIEGEFYTSSNTTAATVLNSPTTYSFNLNVKRSSTGSVIQNLSAMVGGGIVGTYDRRFAGGNWSPWFQVASNNGTVQTNLNAQLHNGWQHFNGLSEISSSLSNSSTMQEIISAMPDRSNLTVSINTSNNTSWGISFASGTLYIERLSSSRAHAIATSTTGLRWHGYVSASLVWLGWNYENNGWRRYNSLAELGLTNSSAIDEIFAALPVNGILECISPGQVRPVFPYSGAIVKFVKVSAIMMYGTFVRSGTTDADLFHCVYNNAEATTKWSDWRLISDQNFVDSRTRYGVTTGTATTLVLTLSPAPASLYTGLEVKVKLHLATGTNPTLNVNGLGAKALYKADGSSRFSGVSGRIYAFIYDGTNFILNSGGGGELNVYTGTTQPTTREGVWIQTSTPISAVRNDLNIWTANAWSSGSFANVPQALSEHTVDESGGMVYVIGGFITGTGYVNTLYRYNPSANTWTTLAALPTVFASGGAVAVAGKIYVIGGYTPSISNVMYCYDIAGNTWTTLAAMPQSSTQHTANAIGNKIYVVGGYTGIVPYLSLYCYDIASNTWSQLADLPTAKYAGASAVVGTRLYYFGGQSSGAAYTAVSYVYDSVTNAWSTIANLPYTSAQHKAVAIGTKIYISGGGRDTPFAINDFIVYDISTNTYTALANMSNAIRRHDMAYANGLIFIIGGMSLAGQNLNTVLGYGITSSTYAAGTFILQRFNAAYGQWQTELVTPDTPVQGVNTRLLSHFDDVYIHDGTTLRGDLPSYYGNGSAWVKFKN